LNYFTPQYNELAGRIKDIAAAAGTILAANALITATIIFFAANYSLVQQ